MTGLSLMQTKKKNTDHRMQSKIGTTHIEGPKGPERKSQHRAEEIQRLAFYHKVPCEHP